MKKLLIVTFLLLAGCTDTDRASFSALGKSGTVDCYSGTQLIYHGVSTGVIQTVDKSDGWEFKDSETGKFIRVSGTCIIRN